MGMDRVRWLVVTALVAAVVAPTATADPITGGATHPLIGSALYQAEQTHLMLEYLWGARIECRPIGDLAEGAEGDDLIVLSNANCEALKTTHAFYDTAWAVFVLAHEEGHAHDPSLIAYNDEAKNGAPDHDRALVTYDFTCGQIGPCEAYADCWGAGHMKRLARVLGFSREQAERFRDYARSQPGDGKGNGIGYDAIPAGCWR